MARINLFVLATRQWLYGSERRQFFLYTDYDNCKGCMTCDGECPVKAIERVRVHAWQP
ncbi:MAG TPA: 4Fe-4S binding protein [Candidatus Brocadiaceae bacterium]